jgi:flagellar basal-body rod protein FlgC
MDLLKSIKIGATGLAANRTKMNLISENLANVETTRTENGGPYRRKMAVFEEKPVEGFEDALRNARDQSLGVDVTEVVESEDPYRMVHNPNHPDADPQTGYVTMPNVNLLTEMADMMVARRAFDANIKAISNTRAMLLKALEIGK